jgi:hypothetical protein
MANGLPYLPDPTGQHAPHQAHFVMLCFSPVKINRLELSVVHLSHITIRQQHTRSPTSTAGTFEVFIFADACER